MTHARSRILAALALFPVLSAQAFQPAWMRGAHSEAVETMSFSPDGKYLATSSLDETIKVWDCATGLILRDLYDAGYIGLKKAAVASAKASGKKNVTMKDDFYGSLAWTADGKRLVTSGSDQRLRLWDVASGKAQSPLDLTGVAITASAVSPKGSMVAAGSKDGTIYLVDGSSLKLIARLKGHAAAVDELLFTPDGRFLVSAASDKSLRKWDPAKATELAALSLGENPVNKMACSPNGERLLVADMAWDEDKPLRVVDLVGFTELGRYVYRDFPSAFRIDNEGGPVAVYCRYNAMRTVDLVTGQDIRNDHTSLGPGGYAIAWNEDGSLLAAGDSSSGGGLYLLDPSDYAIRSELSVHSGPVFDLWMRPDGSELWMFGYGGGDQSWRAAARTVTPQDTSTR
jgi:WD40 repeat protein